MRRESESASGERGRVCIKNGSAPSLTQAATPAITPRQQQLLDVRLNPTPIFEAWRERSVVLIEVEPKLRMAVVMARCAKPGAERLLDPTYRAYVETVGKAYYRNLQRPGPASQCVGQYGCAMGRRPID